MKRDMDLIRLILLHVEEGKEPEGLKAYTEEEKVYNGALAIEAGLIAGRTKLNEYRQPIQVSYYKLTWEGHNFLDAARSDTVWNKVKAQILEKGGSWTMEGLFELLKLTAKQLITQ